MDRLADGASMVARFQGGNNAGHTVVLGERVLKFHLLLGHHPRRLQAGPW